MAVGLGQFLFCSSGDYSFDISLLIQNVNEYDKWFPVSLDLWGLDLNNSTANCFRLIKTPLIHITTKLGYSVTLSPEQDVCTLTTTPALAWSKAKELRCGQWIVVQLGLPHLPVNAEDLSLNVKSPDEELAELWQEYPQKMSVELAEWLGYFMADGFIVRHDDVDWVGFVIDRADDGRIESYLLELTHKLFKLGSPIECKEDLYGFNIYHGPCRALYWPTTGFAQWLITLMNNSIDRIPSCVTRAGTDYICAFLRGYFTALCEPELSKKIRVYSRNLAFLRHMQTVLASLGIISAIHTGVTEQIPSNRDYLFNLSIVSIKGKKLFYENINFLDSRQKDKLREIAKKGWVNEKVDLVPYEVIEAVERTSEGIIIRSSAKEKINTLLNAHKTDLINKYAVLEVIRKNQFYDQIIGIEYSKKPLPAVEFGLELGNSYLVNNFVIKGN